MYAVQLGVGRRVEGNVLLIQEMNLILLEVQRKQQNSLCLSRDSKFRSSEYMLGHFDSCIVHLDAIKFLFTN